jgi:hypothetical protein
MIFRSIAVVSEPLVPQLLDGKKWMLPADVKSPKSDTDLRRPKAEQIREEPRCATSFERELS